MHVDRLATLQQAGASSHSWRKRLSTAHSLNRLVNQVGTEQTATKNKHLGLRLLRQTEGTPRFWAVSLQFGQTLTHSTSDADIKMPFSSINEVYYAHPMYASWNMGPNMSTYPDGNPRSGPSGSEIQRMDLDEENFQTLLNECLAESRALTLDDSPKPFNFLDLPYDIRRMVYIELFGGRNIHMRGGQGRRIRRGAYSLCEGNWKRRFQGFNHSARQHCSDAGIQTSLMFASAGIYAEAIPILYGTNTFRFDKLEHFRAFRNRVGFERYRKMTKLEFSLRAFEYKQRWPPRYLRPFLRILRLLDHIKVVRLGIGVFGFGGRSKFYAAQELSASLRYICTVTQKMKKLERVELYFGFGTVSEDGKVWAELCRSIPKGVNKWFKVYGPLEAPRVERLKQRGIVVDRRRLGEGERDG